MITPITSKSAFEAKVRGSKGGALLLFYSDITSNSDLKKYGREAEDKCGPNYRVYTINIDLVVLANEDVTKYQEGVEVICCTVLLDDEVRFKKADPSLAALRRSIICK